MTSLQNKDGNWIFITAIDGLILTDDIKQEIKINRVTFVSKEKLPRIRIRLGIPSPISKIYKNFSKINSFKEEPKSFFSSSKTYAVIPYKGTPKEKEKDCIRIIEEELNIISLSQLGWSRRRFNRQINIKTSDSASFYRKIDIHKETNQYTFGLRSLINPSPFITESNWVNFHRRFFYFDLIKIINDKSNVQNKWRIRLHRAAVMAGQSQNSNNLSISFLLNVIVLEMLLTNDGEKISEMLVKRAEYFLGWNKDWTNCNYESRIKDIYKKRCDFIHKGNLKYIEIKDLIFTDDLIFNIFNNIIRCKNKIKSMDDIVQFSEKYEAEKLLNEKSKHQFGKFEILRKEYTEEDYKNI